jgi:leader peptidase (prepilin peptidase)/N-methyltransferase
MPEALLAALFGLLVGSFLNVCIHRWPRDLTVRNPRRSQCPECGSVIAWFDNIPVVSWLALGRRCRNCKAAISWRYPLVESLTAILFFLVICHDGFTVAGVRGCVFGAMILTLIFTDLETLILPDEFTISGFFVGVAFAVAVPVPDSTFQFAAGILGYHPAGRMLSLGEALLGGLLPSGALWLLGWTFEKVRHKEGLGLGDVKMIAMIGAFLGLRGALLTIILGSVAGSVIGLAWMKITRRDPSEYPLPFGTFLGAAALAVMFAGGGWLGPLFS